MGNSDELMILSPLVRWKDVETRAWLVVQEIGKSHIEEVGKQSIMRRTGIPARDLRVLDPKLSYPSTILGRERAIVLNLENLKAIVTATEMLILNPNDPGVAPFVSDLEHKLSCSDGSQPIAIQGSEEARKDSPSGLLPEPSDGRPTNQTNTSKMGGSNVLPFEFSVLEICLKFVCKGLESETSTLEQEAYPTLDKLYMSINLLNLQRVRLIKSRLVALFGRVQKIRDELEHLLNDDMDLAKMYLTDKIVNQQLEELKLDDETENDADIIDDDSDGDMRNNKSNSTILTTQKPRIEELEMLLEAYFVQTEGTLSKLSTMREYVHDTEDYINIIMDDKQNQLLQVGVVMSTALVMLNVAIVTIGLLSINVRIPLFDFGVPRQFYETTAIIVGGCTFIYFMAIMWFKRKGLLG